MAISLLSRSAADIRLDRRARLRSDSANPDNTAPPGRVGRFSCRMVSSVPQGTAFMDTVTTVSPGNWGSSKQSVYRRRSPGTSSDSDHRNYGTGRW